MAARLTEPCAGSFSVRLNRIRRPDSQACLSPSFDAMKSSPLSSTPILPPRDDDRGSSIAFYLLMAALGLGLLACIILPFTL